MRKLIFFVILALMMTSARAASTPTTILPTHEPALSDIKKEPVSKLKRSHSFRSRDMQKILGRRLTLKEKIAFQVLKWKIKKEAKHYRQEQKSDKGTIALILGIVALVTLFLPYAILISIPAAIVAIVLGNKAKKENPGDTKAKIGVIMGWVALALFIVFLVVALAILTSSSFWSWG